MGVLGKLCTSEGVAPQGHDCRLVGKDNYVVGVLMTNTWDIGVTEPHSSRSKSSFFCEGWIRVLHTGLHICAVSVYVL
ncbi:unnamed protein product [Callosobruchus maculatus]|uniref:Uncharacterized protein n=1 Tax=Callosobruchus maculatus TaxID=64391 RepID=A0A653BFR5_CALMS|nr:unnamed protein product [Callosobruchus maculatus]